MPRGAFEEGTAKGNPNAKLTARTWQFDSATELKALRHRKGGFHPPQSYRYVGSEELVKLMD
jgi:hypothetical protein